MDRPFLVKRGFVYWVVVTTDYFFFATGTRVRKPLPLFKIELCLLAFFNVEINPDPMQESSIARPEWLNPRLKTRGIRLQVSDSDTAFPSGACLYTN
jgi:hypothetical protein